MGLGKVNKKKGIRAEKFYEKLFISCGFPDCKTSKEVSRHHDNANIDLVNIPFNIQIKAGRQKNMNPGKELLQMNSYLHSMFPADDEIIKRPLLIIHHQDVEIGTERLAQHSNVFMSLQQFDLFRQIYPHLQYDGLKSFKFDLQSEFKHIVSVTFEYFKENVILKQSINNEFDNHIRTGN